MKFKVHLGGQAYNANFGANPFNICATSVLTLGTHEYSLMDIYYGEDPTTLNAADDHVDGWSSVTLKSSWGTLHEIPSTTMLTMDSAYRTAGFELPKEYVRSEMSDIGGLLWTYAQESLGLCHIRAGDYFFDLTAAVDWWTYTSNPNYLATQLFESIFGTEGAIGSDMSPYDYLLVFTLVRSPDEDDSTRCQPLCQLYFGLIDNALICLGGILQWAHGNGGEYYEPGNIFHNLLGVSRAELILQLPYVNVC